MNYSHTVKARFLDRPNRFVAHVELDGQTETVHVKNTGRCRELLVPGYEVILEEGQNPARKTRYDLISVCKEGRWINMDSQAPNKAAEEWLLKGGFFPEDISVYRERKYGNSRFDLYIESPVRKAFMEVKGVTLEEDNIVRFPDAPTERGIKHVRELIRCMKDGYEAYIMFVIQMEDVLYFEPNYATHPEFGNALSEAEKAGVHILAYTCQVRKDLINLAKPVRVYVNGKEESEEEQETVC